MRRTLIQLSALIIAITFTACSTTEFVSASTDKNPELTSVHTVRQGKIQGVYNQDHSVELYAGIPYAKAPVGNLRWKEPQDPLAWDDVFVADHFGSRAMQPQDNGAYNFVKKNFFYHMPKGDPSDTAPVSEDCLYLNIWKPAESRTVSEGKKLPVLFFIHGGSLTTGSSYWHEYVGENLCREDIIVVTVAYRLGVFGYYANEALAAESPNGSTGNYGLLDQIKALEWVHNNIESFGGDASNITIAGESAGSSSVNAICVSPLSKGLFRRAIAESSSITQPVPPHTFRTMEKALQTGNNIMKEFKCASVEELRNVPAKKLIKTKYSNSEMTVDGYALTENPWETYRKGNNNEEALLNGFNADEGTVFTMFSKKNRKGYETLLDYYFKGRAEEVRELYPHKTGNDIKQSYSTLFGVYNFTYPHSVWTRVASNNGLPVYEYCFTKENKEIGTYHSGEMIYAYKNVPRTKYYTAEDFELERIMSSYWVNFVKNGNPNGENLPYWPTAKDAKNQVLELGTTVQIIPTPHLELNKILDSLQSQEIPEIK